MNVLGLHFAYHDSGAALVTDGSGIIAIAEERLNRRKHSGEFPERSIEYCLKEMGLQMKDIDSVVVDQMGKIPEDVYKNEIRNRLGKEPDIECINHHLSHACSAYFPSPFEESAIMVVDGHGGIENGKLELQSFYRGKDRKIEPVKKSTSREGYSFGIGLLYLMGTVSLGWNPLEGGKLMGLSAYGNPEKYFEFMEPLAEGEILLRDEYKGKKYSYEPLRGFKDSYFSLKGVEKKGGEPILSFADTASQIQYETEQTMLSYAHYIKEKTESKNLCIAGGVGLNCPANSLIRKESDFENVFIQPAASDTGCAFGNALYGFNVKMDNKKRYQMKTAFMGKKYTDREIDRDISRAERKVPLYYLKKIYRKIKRKFLRWK